MAKKKRRKFHNPLWIENSPPLYSGFDITEDVKDTDDKKYWDKKNKDQNATPRFRG